MIGKSLFVGEKVELTEIDSDKDTEMLSNWMVYPYFSRMIFKQPYRLHTIAEVKKKFQEMLKEADEHHNSVYFGVRRPGETQLIGIAWFACIEGTNQTAAIRFFFDPEQDLGDLIDEAFHMFLRYGFMELSMYRLNAWIGGDNLEGVALLERSGFLREVQRREDVFTDGRYFDEYIYAMLKPEWKQIYMEGAK